MNTMNTAVIIPCLNEETTLLETCKSLGFASRENYPKNTLLIIVDNGSHDNTLDIAKYVQDNSLKDTVIISIEKEKGYIPPRIHGNRLAEKHLSTTNQHENNVIILQADADTYYSSSYIDIMRNNIYNSPSGTIVEARSEYPSQFIKKYTSYIELCSHIDEYAQGLLGNYSDDVIIDDKACGYRLQDYILWGGHEREYTLNGDEIFAETSRLFIKSRFYSGRRFLVEDAVINHSVRKVIYDSAITFATSGFPRERSWKDKFNKRYGNINIDDISLRSKNPLVLELMNWRLLHTIGLFGLLPLYISKILKSDNTSHPFFKSILDELPNHSISILKRNPGQIIFDTLNILENNFQVIENILSDI